MPLSNELVGHIARLARLTLTPAEQEKFASELTVILDYIDQLKSVDTEGVELQGYAAGAGNLFREDRIEGSLPGREALRNAPRQDGGYILVPRVLG
jgi:aspartyl-tRNA(Asn)/glutamyl-tRNA(Gln) amidotransferase subunit C